MRHSALTHDAEGSTSGAEQSETAKKAGAGSGQEPGES